MYFLGQYNLDRYRKSGRHFQNLHKSMMDYQLYFFGIGGRSVSYNQV